MRFKLPSWFLMRWREFALAALGAALPALAHATLTVAPYGVGNPVLTGQKIYYAARKTVVSTDVDPTTGACPTAIDSGFQIFDVTKNRYAETVAAVTTNTLKLRVTTSQTLSASSGKVLVAMARVTNGSTSKYVPIASVNDATCGGTATCYKAGQVDAGGDTSVGHYYAVPFASGSVLGFYPADICSDARNQFSNTLISGCELNTDTSGTTSGLSKPESVPQASGTPITLEIVITEIDTASTTAPTATVKDSLTTQLYFQTAAPKMTSCNVYENSSLYYPGDGRLFVDSAAFAMATCGSSSLTSGYAPANALIAVASETTDPDVTSSFRAINTLVSEGSVGSFTAITGFTNATTTSDHQYNVSFMIRDAAGLLAPPPGVVAIGTNIADWTYNAVSTANNCNIPNAQASAINGVVAQNRCFIATSAFRRDPQSAPVALLRQFRDEWLEQTALGKRVVRLYYSVSPRIAGQMDDAPILRVAALKLLVPVELIAWIWVAAPLLGWVLLFLGCGLIVSATLSRSKRHSGIWFVLLLVGASGSVERDAFGESFIDEVKVGLEPQESAQGYTDRERLKLGGPEQTNEQFIEVIRPELEKSDDPTGYAEKERSKLTPGESVNDRPSVTETSTTEQKPLEPRYKGDIHFAGGLRYAALMSRTVAGGNGNFTSIYGANYVPEASIFGEWQPFHSEWFGNVGLIGSLGIAVFRGNGQYGVSGLVNPLGGGATFSDASRTQMILNLIPISLGAIYRFNLLRILRPFISASGVMYGMIETRNDGLDAKRTFGLGTTIAGGVSLLMDWFESGSAWDAYASAGIRHSYVTVEYSYLIPLYGDLLYASSGFHAGLTFEF